MSSRYALELERIYGVRGSEYVGYLPTDLALVNPPSPVCHLNRNNFHIEVSSTGSSAERKTVVGMGGEVTKPSISGFGQTNAVVIEKGKPTTSIYTYIPFSTVFIFTPYSTCCNMLQVNRPSMVCMKLMMVMNQRLKLKVDVLETCGEDEEGSGNPFLC